MDEKFLVRVDEEYPSDQRLDVLIEQDQRIDELLKKIDKLVAMSNTDVLSEIKDILLDLNLAIKASSTYEINDHIQDIKDKINKRGEESAELMTALSDRIERLDVREMVSDLTLHVENLEQKYSDLSQKSTERLADTDVMDRHIVSQLEDLHARISNNVSGISEAKIKSINNAINRANRTQVRVDGHVKELSAYLSRLNSVDYMLRLLAAKNLIKRKKLPKWAQEKKKVLDKLILGLEEEIADILIVGAVHKNGISVVDLSKAIGRTRRKTQERVVQLIAAGYVDERNVKGRKLYFLVK